MMLRSGEGVASLGQLRTDSLAVLDQTLTALTTCRHMGPASSNPITYLSLAHFRAMCRGWWWTVKNDPGDR